MKHMKFKTSWAAAAALAGLFVASTATAQGPIQQRKARQQARIAQGIGSGQLTARETARLERGEASLNREERGMRASDGGNLTGRDRRVLDRQQDRLSRDIYRQKHDAQHS
jgi:hypothetical protein